MAKVLEQLGIADKVRAKAKFPPAGGAVGDILARGEADVGFQQMAELISFKGVDVVGLVPSELQSITEYEVATPAGALRPDLGRAFMEFMHTPRGIDAIRVRRLDPR
jgi:molybdate transport system substrate-binding protein